MLEFQTARDNRTMVAGSVITPAAITWTDLSNQLRVPKARQPAVNVIPVLARYSRITSLPMKLPAARSFNAAV